MCVRLHTWPCVLRSQGGQTKNQIRRALNLFRADLTEVEDSDMGELSSDEGELPSESEEGGGRGETVERLFSQCRAFHCMLRPATPQELEQ